MKKYILFLTALTYLMSTSLSSAGEIKVYDANDQFLGILLNSSVYATTIFIPSLGVITEITNHPFGVTRSYADIMEHGNGNLTCCTDKVVFLDSGCTGTKYFDAGYPALIKDRCDGKYYKTNGNMKLISGGYIRMLDCTPYENGHYTGYYQELEETTLPFSIPLSIPLKFKSTKGVAVVPLGN